MNTHSLSFKIRLGLFVLVGIGLFILAIFIIGKQKNLFNPVFKLSTIFYNVSGLQVGNNVRFSGINVGTVDKISIISDSTVQVDMLIRNDVKRFVKSDCIVAIGSEGLIGDRLLIITQGSADTTLVKNKQFLASAEPVETDAIMASLEVTAGNAEIISEELAAIMIQINSGKGTLGRLIKDPNIASDINETISNLKASSKGLNENMEAAKSNILLKGYYKKKAKNLKKEQEEIEKTNSTEQKNKN
jgi:phospholipid/cholesterol/gamma-HCH transport system substrate-binding protein